MHEQNEFRVTAHETATRFKMAPELLEADLELTDRVPPAALQVATDPGTAWAAMASPLLTAGQEPVLAFWMEAGLLADEELRTVTDAAERTGLREVSRRGKNARERMIRSNVMLVLHWANKRVAGRETYGLDFDDVVAAGVCGLTHAVEMFDYRLGWKFSTYATHWIKQSMDRAIVRSAALGITVHDQELLDELNALRRQRLADAQPAPDLTDVCTYLQIGRRAARDLLLLERNRIPDSLHRTLGDDGSTVADLVGDRGADVEEAAVADERSRVLAHALEGLTDRERRVVCARVGWSGGPPATEDEIASSLGVSPQMVRRVAAAALVKLRAALGSYAADLAVAA